MPTRADHAAVQDRNQDQSGTADTDSRPKGRHRVCEPVIVDNSRVAYAEIHDDEKAPPSPSSTPGLWLGSRLRGGRGASPLRQRFAPYHTSGATPAPSSRRPESAPDPPTATNGKIEHFHRTLPDGWAFQKFYNSESARSAALPVWVHHYNLQRPHTAIGRRRPSARLIKFTGRTPSEPRFPKLWCLS